MLQGTVVDNTVIGGPAHSSKAIGQGDVILKIDGIVVTSDNIKGLLVGSDVPGSSVTVTVAKGGPKVIKSNET
jgi:S1-C subfamily serine protease